MLWDQVGCEINLHRLKGGPGGGLDRRSNIIFAPWSLNNCGQCGAGWWWGGDGEGGVGGVEGGGGVGASRVTNAILRVTLALVLRAREYKQLV